MNKTLLLLVALLGLGLLACDKKGAYVGNGAVLPGTHIPVERLIHIPASELPTEGCDVFRFTDGDSRYVTVCARHSAETISSRKEIYQTNDGSTTTTTVTHVPVVIPTVDVAR